MKKPEFFIPQCDDPCLIVNSRALTLISNGGSITSDFPVFRSFGNLNHPNTTSRFLAAAHQYLNTNVNYYSLCNHYVILDNQFEYIYRLVGCGKCVLCQHSRKLDIINRCRMESELYDCPPYFFTLTYQESDLPQDGELIYRDVQLFFKRYRKLLITQGLPTDFRYLVAGEYGHVYGRPHWHVILWNNPYRCTMFSPEEELLKYDLWLCWQKSSFYVFTKPENFGVCGDCVAAYVAKYIGKTDSRHHHIHKPCIHMSTRIGGIGKPFLSNYLDYYKNANTNKFEYMSIKDGKLHSFTMGSWIKNYYHPSPSRLLSPQVRSLYRQITDRFQLYVSLGFPYQDAYNYLESVRPCKNVTRNLLYEPDEIRHHPIMLRYLLDHDKPLFEQFFDALSNTCEVEQSSIDNYYKYILKTSPFGSQINNRGSLAQYKAKLNQDNAILISKSRF